MGLNIVQDDDDPVQSSTNAHPSNGQATDDEPARNKRLWRTLRPLRLTRKVGDNPACTRVPVTLGEPWGPERDRGAFKGRSRTDVNDRNSQAARLHHM